MPYGQTDVAIVCVVVAVIAAISLFAFTHQENTDDQGRFNSFPVPVTDEMRDWMSAEEAEEVLDSAFEDYYAVVLVKSSRSDVSYAIMNLESIFDDVFQDFYFVQWDYSRDLVRMESEYSGWFNLANVKYTELDDAIRDGIEGVNGDVFRELLGDEVVDQCLQRDSMSEEERELVNREAMLMSRYGSVYSDGDPEEMASIYLELIDVRNSIAEIHGYGNYVEYVYEDQYNRDYRPSDITDAREVVKEGFGEIGNRLIEMYFGSEITYTYSDPNELMDTLEPFFDGICPEFTELYDYMRENRLIDCEDLETKTVVHSQTGITDSHSSS